MASVAVTTSVHAASSVTSRCRYITASPSSSASAAPRSSSTSVATTRAPAAASPRTCDSPIPRAAPVTIATTPSSDTVIMNPLFESNEKPTLAGRPASIHERTAERKRRRAPDHSRARRTVLREQGSNLRQPINSALLCQLSYPGRANGEVTASIIAITRRWVSRQLYTMVAHPWRCAGSCRIVLVSVARYGLGNWEIGTASAALQNSFA